MPRLLKCYGKKCEERDLKYPKEELIEIGSKRYCKKCAEEKEERDKLSKYICEKIQVPFVPTAIQKQMNDYHKYYSYHDIQLALQYAWDVEKKYIRKNTIGIVPYIIEEALRYYQKQNELLKNSFYDKKEIVLNYKNKDRRINVKNNVDYDFELVYNQIVDENNF